MCDTSANLSALGAFQIVEDAITELMGILELDGETCVRKYDGMWIYVRNRVELRRKIHWMDEFVIECYVSSISGVKMVFDTVIKTNNEIAVVSRAESCAIDRQTGRVRRANTVGLNENITV
jgi:acyl-CoA thioesterase FadM